MNPVSCCKTTVVSLVSRLSNQYPTFPSCRLILMLMRTLDTFFSIRPLGWSNLCDDWLRSSCRYERRSIRAGSSFSAQSAVSAVNAACNTHSNVTYLLSCWPPWTVGDGGMSSFFVQGLGLALLKVAKSCPHRPQAFKKVNNGQAFPQEKQFFSFSTERAHCSYSKACLTKVSRIYLKI